MQCKPMGRKPPKTYFSLGACRPSSNRPVLWSTPHTTPNGSSMASHFYTTKSPLVTMGCPTSTPQNCQLSRVNHQPQPYALSHPYALSLDPTDPLTQTAPRSNHSFFHNTPDKWRKEGLIDMWDTLQHLYQYQLMLCMMM